MELTTLESKNGCKKMKKEYIKPEIERFGIYAPNNIIFGCGKTPLILVNDDKE